MRSDTSARARALRNGAQLWALDMAVDAAGEPSTDRASVDLALALAAPLGPSLSLGTDAFTVAGPPRWRLLSVVPWAGAQAGPVSSTCQCFDLLLGPGLLCETTISRVQHCIGCEHEHAYMSCQQKQSCKSHEPGTHGALESNPCQCSATYFADSWRC
jgi:hypothetical protein